MDADTILMGKLARLIRSTVVLIATVAVFAAAHAPALAEDPPAETTTTTSTTVVADPQPEPTEPAPVVQTPAPEPPAPVAAPAPGPIPTFKPVVRYDVKRTLVFPIIGVSKYWSSFGACRDNCTREHHGIDIVTYDWKGLPVVAAHDGTVVKVTHDKGNAGCSVRIRARDRWETRYLHLNNDIPGTDTKGYSCPAPGIEVGAQVVAGQIIGYVGDSGNSENTVPHLHFELRNRSGYPIDPYRSLKASRKIVYEWLPSDMLRTTIALSKAANEETVPMVFLISTDEIGSLGLGEASATILNCPVIAVDADNPMPALAEIQRLSPGRIVILTDTNASWLERLARPFAAIVESGPVPMTEIPANLQPDGLASVPYDNNTPDAFVTVVSGVVDRIWRSRVDEYQDFASDHRTIVLSSDIWAKRGIGEKSWNSPGKYAEEEAVWWLTGDGWVSQPPADPAPQRGVAYLTEKRAVPWTLSYLGFLAEMPPMPVWKSS
jgi:murein DD-endopeptidase MepM/ murein hydrolase activator NlpD